MAPQIKGVLFDMDGTLIESKEIWYEILHAATIHFGAEPLAREVWRPTYGQSQQQNIELFMPHVKLEDLENYCNIHYREHTDKIVVLDKAPEVVKAALEHTFGKSYIVTNCPRPITEMIVDGTKATFLKNSFGWEKIVCASDDLGNGKTITPKPDPHMIEIAAAKLGLKPSECMMVGDSAFDMMVGKAAGCALTVGIEVDGGDIRVNAIADLLEVIASLPKNSA